jgi:hypothetical protein
MKRRYEKTIKECGECPEFVLTDWEKQHACTYECRKYEKIITFPTQGYGACDSQVELIEVVPTLVNWFNTCDLPEVDDAQS